MEIRVREERLPGIGMRYDIDLGAQRGLFVIAESRGPRHLGLMGRDGTPDWQITISQEQAVMLSALLLGARFTLDTRDDDRVAGDEVVVDTVELSEASPLIGKTRAEIMLPAADAAVLAVISDATPELVEDDATYRCRPLDRVVVAARAAEIDEVAAHVRVSPAGNERDTAR